MKSRKLLHIIALSALTVAIVGCNGVKKNQAVLDAEKLFGQAQADSQVLQYASKELELARQALEKAGTSENEGEMTSLAYIAETRTKTAIAVAERKKAAVQIDKLGKVTGQEKLEAREMELQREQVAKEQALHEKEMALRAREEALASSEALKKELAALQAIKTERGMVMTLGDVLFATGKSELLPGAMSTIDRLAAFLDEYPGKTVLVEGHTDDVGSAAFNQNLSEKRANAVRNALMRLGTTGTRIDTIGLGETQPIADNTSEAGKLKNRRVEIVIRD